MTSARSIASRRPSTLSSSISAFSSSSSPSPSPTKPARRPSLQVKTSMRTALPDRRASAVSKLPPRTAAALHTPLAQQRASDALLYSLHRAPHSAVEVSSIHDHIWRLQERLREMGPAYLSGDSGVAADMYVAGVPLDAFSPSSASPSSSSDSPARASPKSAPASSSTTTTAACASSSFCSKRPPSSVSIRVLIHPADGSRPKLVCRDFKLSEARSTIPEARRLPSLSGPSIAATPATEASAARKTLFELGVSSPVIGPSFAVAATAGGEAQLLSPFAYRPAGPCSAVDPAPGGAGVPMSPFPREPLIGFERRKSLASLGVGTPTATTGETAVPMRQRVAGASRGMPMHLEYARAYLPVLAALMLSGNVSENDRIEICLPYPDAWEATVSHIYTGLPAANDKIRANSRYLGGKL